MGGLGLGLARCCRQSVVTALDDLERLGFVTRIRRIRRVQTPLGFKVLQITNAYRVHEPTSGLGLLAIGLFASESNYFIPSEAKFYSKSNDASRANTAGASALWPAPGSEDTELGVLMELEVGHGETEVYPRVQA
jgi:hypothetical protein